MSGAIRPFEKLKSSSRNGGATVKYVERRLREELGRLHFTGSAVKSSADGQIHIDPGGDDGTGTDYPFKITASGAGIILGPGYVSMNGNLSYGIVKINGQSITPPQNANNWSAPVLAVPNDVGSRINYPDGTAEEGTCYVRIGQVNKANNGSLTVLVQDWRNNIAASPQGDGYVFLAAK